MNEINAITPSSGEEYLALLTRKTAQALAESVGSKKGSDIKQLPIVEIEGLSPEELTVFVGEVIASLSEEKHAADLIKKFARTLSNAKLQFPPELGDTLELAVSLQESARQYLETTRNDPPSSTMTVKMHEFWDSLVAILDGWLHSLGISDLFDPTDDTATKSRKITLLIGLVFAVSAILIPLLGLSQGLIILVAIAIAVVVFGKIYPMIRPMPGRLLPEMENWSLKYRAGQLKVSKEPSPDLRILAKELERHHPVVITGPSGIGKTELIKSFVQAIEQEHYPHLKGKRIYYINAGGLTQEQLLLKLPAITRNMGRHRENMIVVFDNLPAGDERFLSVLQDMLHEKAHFPYFIGIADATQSPLHHIEGTHISMENPNEVTTRNILQYASLNSPEIIIPPKSLDYLIAQTTEEFGQQAPMPRTALEIFSACVHKTSKSQFSPTEQTIDALRAKILAKRSHIFLPNDHHDEIGPLKEAMRKLEADLENENLQRATFFALREYLPEIKETLCEHIIQMNETSSEKDKNFFLLLNQYFIPALEKTLGEKAARLGVRTELSKKLIDQVIAEEKLKIKS